jgi:thioester reductase-like protein
MMKYHLLTGATGLLGRYLLRDLTLADLPLAVVVRPSLREPAAQRIETAMARWEGVLGRALVRPVVLEGDVTHAGLGFSPRDTAWVAQHVESMIHSAASLTFYADEADGEPQRSNVLGTRHVLEFCRRSGIRRFHHVSTAYICGRRRGRILESELDVGQEPGNDYEASKITAEKEVRACEYFDTVTVYRPSIITGDSRTGYTTSYHGFYTPLRLVHALAQNVSWDTVMNSNWLGGLALRGDERKNFVPVDWVSGAMTHLITHPETHGGTYHLTNPQPVAVALLATAIGATLGEAARNRHERRADRLMHGEEMIASFREQMKVYQSYWSDDPEFDSSRTQAAMPRLPCPAVDDAVMQRLIRFAVDANFGWPKETPVVARYDVARVLQPWLPAAEHLPPGDDRRRYVSLRISGSGGGQWHLIIDDDRLIAALPGLCNGDGTVCHLTSDTFSQLACGRLTWQSAVDTGRLVVAGKAVAPRLVAQCLRDLINRSSPTSHTDSTT